MFNRQKVTSTSQNPDSTPAGSWRSELQRLNADGASDDNPTREDKVDPGAKATEPTAKKAAPAEKAEGKKATLDDLMGRLDNLSQPKSGASQTSRTLTSDVSSHTDALRATLNAQQQAQRMLELATKERNDASAQSEQILLEAKAMAERVQSEAEADTARIHRETKAWAADQRKAIEILVGDLKATATVEAAAIREEAARTAKSEAEAAGAAERARHQAAAAKDAEATRAQARALLDHSSSLLNDIHDSAQALTESVNSFLAGLKEKADAIGAALTDPALATAPEPTMPSEISDADLAKFLSEPVIPQQTSTDDSAPEDLTDSDSATDTTERKKRS